LLFHLAGPISRSRFNVGALTRLIGESPDAPLHPPQQAKRVGDASRRGFPGAHQSVEGVSVQTRNAFLFDDLFQDFPGIPQAFKDFPSRMGF